jgi:DNA gyrase subunit B
MMENNQQRNRSDYDESQIQVLEGLEAVRKRPGMYIGSTSIRGLHHLVYEVVDNSIDESMAGFCDEIKVTIHKDMSVTVQDNGRGIPVGIQEKMHKPAVEVALTMLHAGGKFGSGGYSVSGGLHGVGVAVVNALSEWLVVKVKRDGHIYTQRYERGVTKTPLEIIGDTEETGTTITFKPDHLIFDELNFSYDTLRSRLRELAFLNAGLRIEILDERTEEGESFHYEGGIISFVEYLNKNRAALFSPPIYISGEKGTSSMEVALQYNDSYVVSQTCLLNNLWALG